MLRKAIFSMLALLLLWGSASAQEQKYDFVEIKTKSGSIWLYLYDATPQHKANFLKLAREGYFDGTTFHRVIPEFMIQGGDPNSKDADSLNDGEGGPGYTTPAEISDSIRHFRGAVGAARDDNPAKASSGSQFYLVEGKTFDEAMLARMSQRTGASYSEEEKKRYATEGGTPFLDLNYTVFGEVFSGFDLIKEIARVPRRDGNDRPFENVKMEMKVHTLTPKKLKKKHKVEFDIAKMQSR